MFHKTKKRLIHFYTNGNIAEDFVASRRAKVNKLRGFIRACFYLHCTAALTCIGLSLILGAGAAAVPITICALIAAWFALFAVGDLMVMKVVLCVLDFAFAGGAFVAGAFLEPKSPFFVCGGIMTLAGFLAIGAVFAAVLREFLEEYSPRLIRREDYTILYEVSEERFESPEEEEDIPPLPPLTSEMRELSKQLRDILCTGAGKDPIIEEIKEKSTAEIPHENGQFRS